MTTNDKIIDWIVNRVKNDYVDDIALILIYGSYVNGTANAKSDVDCYFIPRTERGYQFAADFIIQDVGYDIFPMSWERVEGIANLKEILIPCVGDVKVLYHHSIDELEKFKSLQKLLQDNLNNSDYTRKIAKDKFECAACFIKEYENVIQSEKAEEIKEHCWNLIKIFADFMEMEYVEEESQKEEKEITGVVNQNTDFYFLARIYEEISSTFNKIYVCAETGNFVLAFLSAVCLQNELKEISKEQGIKCYDILSSYYYKDLGKLAQTVRMVERDLVQVITDGGEKIKKFADFAEFERARL